MCPYIQVTLCISVTFYCFNCFLLHTGVYFSFITHIALLKFDTYVDQIRTCVKMNTTTFTEGCIQCGILAYPTNTIVYQNSDEVLESIRANIVQNGTVILLYLIKVLEKMEDSRELAIKLKGMAMK